MLSEFLVYLVALFNDGNKQRFVIKFIDDTITAHTGAITGVANNLGGIAWCRVFSQFFDLRCEYSGNFRSTFDEFVEGFSRLAGELYFTHFSCVLTGSQSLES